MSAETWVEKHRILSGAGLIVLGRSTKKKLENLQSMLPIIEAAHTSGVTILDSNSVENLLSLVPDILDQEIIPTKN